MGDAMKIDEQVPKMTPRVMAKAKPLMLLPPMKRMQSNTMSVETEVLTDTVEDNHLIVDGVTDHGQHGTDECLVDLE